jgi:parallel beta-helix repeat protein
VDFDGNSYNNITDSQIIGNDGIGIDLGGVTEHQRIENCTIRENGDSGVDLEGSSYIDITKCNISKNKGEAGIFSASQVMNINITNSEIWANLEDGIEIYSATYVNITNSIISENVRNGIIFNGSDIQELNTVNNCEIFNNGYNGIHFYTYALSSEQNIQYNDISYNTIYSNLQNGVFFETHADYRCSYHSYIQNNNVFNNTLYSNDQNGIYFYMYTHHNTQSSYIQNNNIFENIVYSNNQNGIYLEAFSEDTYIYIKYNKFHNNTVYLNDKSGIHFNLLTDHRISYFRYNDINNNTVHSNNQNGIFLNSSYYKNAGSYYKHNNIFFNTIHSNTLNGIDLSCFGREYSEIELTSIFSNTIYSNGKNGIYFYCHSANRHSNLEYNYVYSNIIYLNDQDGIYFSVYSEVESFHQVKYFSYIQFNEIYSNTIHSNNRNGFYLYGNSRNGHLFIQNNYVYSNVIHFHVNGCGIYIHSDNNTVTWENSHIYKNTINLNLIGIRLLRIDSHIVYINNISNSQNDGICLDNSNSSTISYNTIANNNLNGITLTNDSNINKIQNNNITSNNQTGISVSNDSDSNTITRNDIRDNLQFGLNIMDSTDNYVHHNNFINNNQNAYDSTTQLNDWDDSVEGNWWDDYTGFDANGDGIGDIPYDVPGGGSKDWYPIIDPANITAPHIESTTPEDGDVNISVTPLISITFSNKMNRTATELAISISGGLSLINFTWNNGDLTVSFEPSDPLGSSTEYTITISLTAKDVLENHLEEPYQYSFTTKDVVPPYITFTSPFHYSVDVALNTDIIVTFSEPMNITTATFSCSPDPGGWSGSWSNMNSQVTFTHDDFGSLTTYTFEITGGKDIGGNDLIASPIENPWVFTTMDVEGPEITTTSPVNGSVGVLLSANVVVTFSEQMNTSSVIFSCIPDPGSWSVSWTNGDKTVTYSHNDFITQTIYTFHISAGKDIAGNTLNPSLPNPWSFSTVDTTSPMIVGNSPSNSSTDVPLNADIIVTFSEEMDPLTVTIICNPNPEGWVVTWGGGNTEATYSHNPFSEKTTYTFQITGGKDTTANDLVDGVVPNPWVFTTQDVTPPQIISTFPVNGSLNIDLNTNIVITFSEAMNISTFDFICTPYAGGWSTIWNLQGNIVTLAHDPFTIDTTYTMQINSAMDVSGNALVPGIAENPWSFTTIGDNVGPQITSTTPAENAQYVDQDSNIQIAFSEAIDPTTLSYVCSPDPGGWIEGWSNGNTVLMLSHNQFAIGTTFTFYVSSARDISGNDLEAGGVTNPWSFTTVGDLVAPQIISTSPSDNEENIDPNTNLVITFSKPMDISTVDYTCSPDPGGWFGNWNSENTAFTLMHSPFEIQTTYSFQITSGKDLVGNNLTSGTVPLSWDFTTIAVDSLIITPSEASILVGESVVFIAWAYDSQNNPITDISYNWSLNNNLGTLSSQGTQAVTYQASSETGTSIVNVNAGGNSTSATITVKAEDVEKKESEDSDPEDLMWIWFLIIVIIIISVINLWLAIRKRGPEGEVRKTPDNEDTHSKEITEKNNEKTKEPEFKPLPPPPPSD